MIKLGGRRESLAALNRVLIGIDGVTDGVFLAPEDLDTRPTARTNARLWSSLRNGHRSRSSRRCAARSIRYSCRAG